MNFLLVPATLVAIGAIIGGSLIGVLYLVGIFGKTKADQRKEAEEANQYVIKSLQQQVEELEKRVDKQREDLDSALKQIESLRKENYTLQELVSSALKDYFEKNPEIAVNLGKSI